MNTNRLAARPCDALDECATCTEWVRTGQSYHPTPAGLVHEHCPAPTVTGADKVRLHTPAADDPRRAGVNMNVTIYRELEQRSPAWLAARAGLVTASAVGSLIVKDKPAADTFACEECAAPADEPCISLRGGKPIKTLHGARYAAAAKAPELLTVADNDTSRGLITTLAAERITGHVEDTAMTRDMFRGVISEPFARDAYAEHQGVEVEEVGFMVRHFDGFDLGYSPDGLVGEDGLIEVKSPRAKSHITTAVTGEVPVHYMAQLQTGLLVTGRKWIDYISFHGGMALYVLRVLPDPAWQTAIKAAAAHAEAAIHDIAERYRVATDGLPLTERIPDPFDEITVWEPDQ